MIDPMPPLPGLSPVSGKTIVARFDGGLLSSDGGILVLREVEQRLRVANQIGSILCRRCRACHLSQARQSSPDLMAVCCRRMAGFWFCARWSNAFAWLIRSDRSYAAAAGPVTCLRQDNRRQI